MNKPASRRESSMRRCVSEASARTKSSRPLVPTWMSIAIVLEGV